MYNQPSSSNYYIGQMIPNQYQWPQFPYQQESTGMGVNLSTNKQEGTTNSPVVISPSHHDEDSDSSAEPTLVSPSVKVICPGEKRADHKTFVLHGVNVGELKSMSEFRKVLQTQLGDKVIDRDCEFDFGYYKGTKRIWVRGDYDIKDLLSTKSLTLWCEGRSKKRKRKPSESSGSGEDFRSVKKKKKTTSEERMDKVDDIVDDLRAKHKNIYTNMQYRVWAETIVGSRHDSLEQPPKGSFFKGSKDLSSKQHSPLVNSGKSSTPITPVKAAELKTIYIAQIKDLHSLLQTGAISENDFQKQKTSILDAMDKL